MPKRLLGETLTKNKRLKCECYGYWFPHRRTGGACTHGPRSEFYLALRAGVEVSEAQALLPSWQLEVVSPE